MVTAKLRYLRISPRKVRLVTGLIKGLSVDEAERQLKFLTKRASLPILKLLNSAVANAQNDNLTKDNLYIAKITVDPGATLKRWRARAFGRATPIMKRTSHVTIVLDAIEPSKAKVKKEEKAKPEEKETPTPEGVGVPTDVGKTVEEKEPVIKPKPTPPPKPYPTTPSAKKRFFSRQTFGNAKKFFRRKSL